MMRAMCLPSCVGSPSPIRTLQTAVGELPEAREASHQSHEEAADEGKDTT